MAAGQRGQGTTAQQRARAIRRRNLWIRRIVTGIGLLAVIALVVFGLWKIFESVRDAFSSQDQSDDTRVQLAPVETAPCDLADLTFSMDGPRSVASGSAADFPVTVTSHAAEACSWNSGALGLRVTSGEDIVHEMRVGTPSEAQSDADQAGIPLLFGVGDSWTTNLHWDGTRNRTGAVMQSGASGGEPVEGGPVGAGTYVTRLTLSGRDQGTSVVFDVEPAPVAPEEGAQSGAEAAGDGAE